MNLTYHFLTKESEKSVNVVSEQLLKVHNVKQIKVNSLVGFCLRFLVCRTEIFPPELRNRNKVPTHFNSTRYRGSPQQTK